MIIGIVSMVAFNLIDTIYISMLGTRELAALSFTFPVVMVMSSMALGLGMGASAVISRAIGSGNMEQARRLTTDSLFLAVMLVGCCVIVGLLTIKPLFSAMGASEDIIELISQYMTVWYPAMLFVVIPMTGNNVIRACGDTRTPAAIMMTAVVLNAILDPLLIFGIGPFPSMGIRGAAVATMLSRSVTLVLSVYILHWQRKMVTLKIPGWTELRNSWSPILNIAIPAAATRLILPLGAGILTRIAAQYGNGAVAAMGVATRIEFVALAVVMALSSVLGPFTGQNYGAGRIDRVREAFRISCRFSLQWGFGTAIVLYLLSGYLPALFSKDPDTLSALKSYLLIVPIGFGAQGIFALGASALNVLGRPLTAAALSIVQMLLITVPLAWIFSQSFGMTGIFGAILIAFIIGGGLSGMLVRSTMAGLNPERV
jgi:putative MATE family efflux protein